MLYDRGIPHWTIGEINQMTPERRREHYRALIRHWTQAADGSIQCDTQFDHDRAIQDDEIDL